MRLELVSSRSIRCRYARRCYVECWLWETRILVTLALQKPTKTNRVSWGTGSNAGAHISTPKSGKTLQEWLKRLDKKWEAGKRVFGDGWEDWCIVTLFYSRRTVESLGSPQMRISRDRESQSVGDKGILIVEYLDNQSINLFPSPRLPFILDFMWTDERHGAEHCWWDHVTCLLTRVWLTQLKCQQ